MEGFNKVTSAVTALADQPNPPTSQPQSVVSLDQFSAFGEMIAHRLRTMDADESLTAMSEISAVIFRKRSSFFSL